MTAIPYVLPKPKRIAQGFPLTSQQHDDCHTDDTAVINMLVDAVNSLIIGSANLPPGVSLAYTCNTLPAGRFLWEDGSAVSRTTYSDLNTLFAADGYPWGNGDGTTTFNLPKPQGRSRIYANPINNISADTPTLSARVLGTKYGAESYTNASVAVTGNTPAIGISFSNMGSVTFPTFSAGTAATLNFSAGTAATLNFSAGTLPTCTFPTLNAESFPALTGGALPSFPTYSLAPNTANITIPHSTCTFAGTEVPNGAMSCVDLLLSTAAVAAALNVSPSGGSVGSFQTLTAGTHSSLNSGSFSQGTLPTSSLSGYVAPTSSLSGYVAPSSTGGTNTVSGAVATAPSTALSGVTAAISVPTVTVSLCYSSIISY